MHKFSNHQPCLRHCYACRNVTGPVMSRPGLHQNHPALQHLVQQNGVLPNPHRRDLSWSTCSDSDMRSGSVFSSSDNEHHARYQNVRARPNGSVSPQQNGDRISPAVHQQQMPTRPYKSVQINSKKHVTFQTANGINPLNPAAADDSGRNRHFKESNILYYEDDPLASQHHQQYYPQSSAGPHRAAANSEQLTHSVQNGAARLSPSTRQSPNMFKPQERAETVLKRPQSVPLLTSQQHRSSPIHVDRERLARTSSPSGHQITSFNGSHAAMSHHGAKLSGHHANSDSDVITDTNSDGVMSRKTPQTVGRQSPSQRSITPTNGSDRAAAADARRKSNRSSLFDKLTDDVIVRILSHLPSDNVCRVSGVCRRWYYLAYEPSLWTCIRINNEQTNIDKALKVLTRRLSVNTPTVCVMVEEINLNGCEQLTDKGLYTIAKRCPELRQLEMTGCPNVSNIALFELVSSCVNLEHLNIAGMCTT